MTTYFDTKLSDNDVTPLNNKGDRHGYWVRYWSGDRIWYEGNYINGENDGMWKKYSSSYELILKEYYII